jgi:hypothetical protein
VTVRAAAVAGGVALVVGRGGVAATCVVQALRRQMLGRRGGPDLDDWLDDLQVGGSAWIWPWKLLSGELRLGGRHRGVGSSQELVERDLPLPLLLCLCGS